MKKILVSILIVIFFTTQGYAIVWHKPAQDTIIWDAQTLLSGRSVTYRVYLIQYNADKTTPDQPIVETNDTQFTITFPDSGGNYICGVSTVADSGTASEEESSINWSDVNGTSTSEPFGWEIIGMPINLRRL